MGRPENSVIIEGALGKDAEVKQFNGGYTLARFSICQNSSRKNKETQKYDIPCWYDCQFWPKTDADENTLRNLVKGAKVKVFGQLDMDSWVDKNTQKKVNKVFILVNDIQFNERSSGGRSNDGYSQRSPASGGNERYDDGSIPF